jgi:hypothetical protein
MPLNPILDSVNESIQLTNLFGIVSVTTFEGVPLGSVGDSALGEVFVKVGIVSGGNRSADFSIPSYDTIEFTYIGATNNVDTQVFKLGATTVATLTYTYVGAGAADNDRVASIVQS